MNIESTNDTAMMSHRATLAGVFLLSLSLILTEMLLTRVFSVMFMYHFAFLVISLALFGLGVGGIAVYLYPRAFGGDLQRRVVTLVLCFTAALIFLVLFLFDLPLTPSASLRGTLTVAMVYVVASLPFFFGGTCLSVLLGRAGQGINRLYFADLLGAGTGCLLIVPALDYLGGVTSLMAAAAVAASAALLFATPARKTPFEERTAGALLQRVMMVIGVAVVLAVVGTFVMEPLAALIGARLFKSHPSYAHRPHSFAYYFDAQIKPELVRLATSTRLPLMIGALAVIVGLVMVRRWRSQVDGRRMLARQELRLVGGVVLVAAIGLVGLNLGTNAIRVRFAKSRVEFQTLFEGWNSFSRIAVLPHHGVETNILAWGLSTKYKGGPSEQLALDIDSQAGTPLVKFNGNLNDPNLEHLSYDITALAYTLRPARQTLVIGGGGGRDVLTALKYGSKDVTVVELNPIIVHAVDDVFGDFTGRLYERPDVHLVIGEGRNFVRGTQQTFGLIQLSLVDTWASSAAGAFALSENGLYTTEAFVDYVKHLQPDGVLTVSRWMFEPPRETLRVVSLARAALAQLGVTDISRHIIVAGTPELRRGHQFGTVVISRSPFTDEEIATAQGFIDRLGFEPKYLPGHPVHPIFSELITTKDPQEFFDHYEYDVTPTTDDRPFFFNPIKAGNFLRIWETAAKRMGVHLLARLGVVVLLLVVLFMIGPLLLRRRSVLGELEPVARWATLFYFGALGSGFMLVEVCLISKLVLFLGHPTYALTVVLCTMLITAGLGSNWSGQHVEDEHAALKRILPIALIAIGALGLTVDVIFPRMVGAAFPIRLGLTVLTLAPAGFLMGMPFPLGLRLLARSGSEWGQLIPWVWGINGASSVFGSVLAISIAINFGFRMTLVMGMIVYALAFAALRYLVRGAVPVAAKRTVSDVGDSLQRRVVTRGSE